MAHEWTNWAGSLFARPVSFLKPTSVPELQAIITSHPDKTIRAVGTGHSWSPLVVTPDVLIDSTGITENGLKVWRWQQGGRNLVTYLPSARWADVRDALTDPTHPLPLMYPPTAGVLPSINATGFAAVGGHGTGWLQPTLSDLIYAIEIVDSHGQVHVFSEDTTPGAMNVVRVNLGMLGVISKVTLNVEPMYRLWDQEQILPTADVMGPNPTSNGGQIDVAKVSKLVTSNDYIELFWFPWSGCQHALSSTIDDGFIWVKQWNTTQDAPRDLPPQPPSWQDALAQKMMEWIAASPTHAHRLFPPVLVPPTQLFAWHGLGDEIRAIQKTNGFIADAPRVFHYQESAYPVLDVEVALPLPTLGPKTWDFTNVVKAWYQVVNYVRDRYSHQIYPLTSCLHARFTKSSQALLSAAFEPAGSTTQYCWIEVLSAYPKAERNPNQRKADMASYEDLVNTIIGSLWIKEMGGRPHWPKYWQHIPGIEIRSLFPSSNFAQFDHLRRQFDPDGMFLNDFLRRLNLFG